MNELPEKLFSYDEVSVGLKINEIIDYLASHTLPEETKQWAYTFLGDTANIRCDQHIKHVMVFRGGKQWKFTIPSDENSL